MHFAKKFRCRVLEVIPAALGVVQIRFEPSKRLSFIPGQFVSMVIPPSDRNTEPVKRCYSFSSAPEEAKHGLYELCVKLVPGGTGSYYLARLRPGDIFEMFAAYGDFRYRPPRIENQTVCFICTSTGIGPVRSMILSNSFLDCPPKRAIVIHGARTEGELLYREAFASVGVETVYAVSNASGEWAGFHGRVTDYLHTLPKDWSWHSTQFYLCGNGNMVSDVAALLTDGHGVSSNAVHRECFTAIAGATKPAPPAPAEVQGPRKSVLRIPRILFRVG